jgi:hypothetical protein
MKSKEILIRKIVEELKNIPDDYLKNVYEIIHTVRENVPARKLKKKSDEAIWDQVLDEIHQAREQQNRELNDKLDRLFT